MSQSLPARVLHVTIAREMQSAYRFLARPENMSQWASGLGQRIEQRAGKWFTATPEGDLEVRFSPENPYGVLDHQVVLANGQIVNVPMRVVANGDGCELTFVLFRQPGMSDDKFDQDTVWVTRDLETLKTLLEA